MDEEKPRSCTHCGRQVKGHVGPCGKNCTLAPVTPEPGSRDGSESVQATEQVGEKHRQQALRMERLCSTLEKVTFSLEVIASGQREILHRLDHVAATPLSPEAATQASMEATAPLQSGSTTKLPGAVAFTHVYDAGLRTVTRTMDAGNETTAGGDTIVVNGHRIPEKPARAAQCGEWVDLVDFLPSFVTLPMGEIEPVLHVSGNTVALRQKRPRRVIDGFSTWLSAWNNYEALLVQSDHRLYSRLVRYRQHIQELDRKFRWQAVLVYDCRFRLQLAETKCFDYHQLDKDLYVQILDASAIKPGVPRCHRCRAFDHMVAECPFPKANSLEEVAPQKTRNRNASQDQWLYQGKEGCNRYQTGQCRFNDSCIRAHVCKGCKGSEPFYKCRHCNPDKVAA